MARGQAYKAEVERVTTPPPGRKNITTAQKARRDEMLIEARLRGRSEKSVAEMFKITDRQVRNIMADYAAVEKPMLRGRDPLDIVWENAERYEHWIEQLAEIAATADNDSARVGAINSQASIQDKLVDLLQKAGIMPRNLGELRVQADIRYIALRFVARMQELNIPTEQQDALMSVITGDERSGG